MPAISPPVIGGPIALGTLGSVLYVNPAGLFAQVEPENDGDVLTLSGGLPVWAAPSGGVSIGDTITGATEGSVLFAGAAGVLAQDNTNFFWNDTDNALILAGTPPASATKSLLRLGDAISGGSASGTYLGVNSGGAYAGDLFHFQANGTSVIKASTTRVDVNGTLRALGSVSETTTAVSRIDMGVQAGTPRMIFEYGATSKVWEIDNEAGTFRWFTPGVVRMSLDTNGRLGLGAAAGGSAVTYQFRVQTNQNNLTAAEFKAHATQTADLIQVLNSSDVVLASVSSIGAGLFRPLDAVTNAVTTALTLGHHSSGTPAAGFGGKVALTLESSTTDNRDAAALQWLWDDATDASRKGRFVLSAVDSGGTREIIRGEGSGTAGELGFFGATAVAQAAAITQTYSTADRTHAARTAAAITDNTAGTPGTTLAALPDPADAPASADALRDDLVANVLPVLRDWAASLADQVNKGRVDALDSSDLLNSVIDDLQAYGLET